MLSTNVNPKRLISIRTIYLFDTMDRHFFNSSPLPGTLFRFLNNTQSSTATPAFILLKVVPEYSDSVVGFLRRTPGC